MCVCTLHSGMSSWLMAGVVGVALQGAGEQSTSSFNLQAAVRVVAHDPLHCAEVQPEDVLQLARLAIAAVGQFPVAAGYLFGILAKLLEQDCAAAQALRQLDLMQQLLQALQTYLCWQLTVGEGGSKRATAYTRALTIQLTGLVGNKPPVATEASTAAVAAGHSTTEENVLGEDGVSAEGAPRRLVAGSSSQHAVSSTKRQKTTAAAAAAGSTEPAQALHLVTPSSTSPQQQLPLFRRLHQLLALTPASSTSCDSVRLKVAEALGARLQTAELQAALAAEAQLRQRAEQQAEQLLGEKEELQSEAEQQKRAAMRAQQQLAQAHEQAAAAAAARAGTPPPSASGVGSVSVPPAGAGGRQSALSSPAAVEVGWDELADPLLAVMDPQQVSPEQAQHFILRLHAAREGCRQMRTAFCSMLKHLSTGLYSSSARLVHELIQNAEDAHGGGSTGLGDAPETTGKYNMVDFVVDQGANSHVRLYTDIYRATGANRHARHDKVYICPTAHEHVVEKRHTLKSDISPLLFIPQLICACMLPTCLPCPLALGLTASPQAPA
jgi:hypothetical protein